MFEKFLGYFGIVLLLAFAFWLGWISHKNPPIPPPIERIDTLYLRDTVTVSKPIYFAKKVVDSVLVPVRDTVTLRDTLFIALEKEQVEWRDTLSTVWASGVEVAVDSVRHYVTERVIVKETVHTVKEKTRWGVGIQGGVGASKDGLTPYVGVGVSYNLLSW